MPEPGRVVAAADLAALGESLRAAGKVVVWTNGCFDLLHAGHARSLEAARSLGDVLVVGVNADESVRRLKGPGRPVVPEAERAELVAALRWVDFAVVFADDTPERCIGLLRPDIHCKSADYAPPHGKPIPDGGAGRVLRRPRRLPAPGRGAFDNRPHCPHPITPGRRVKPCPPAPSRPTGPPWSPRWRAAGCWSSGT